MLWAIGTVLTGKMSGKKGLLKNAQEEQAFDGIDANCYELLRTWTRSLVKCRVFGFNPLSDVAKPMLTLPLQTPRSAGASALSLRERGRGPRQ